MLYFVFCISSCCFFFYHVFIRFFFCNQAVPHFFDAIDFVFVVVVDIALIYWISNVPFVLLQFMQSYACLL